MQALFSRWSAEHRLVGIAVGRLDGVTTSTVAVGVRRINGDAKIAVTSDFEITRDGNQLYAQATSQQRLPVYAESATTFFYKVVKSELIFQVDATGTVTGLVLRQNGIDQTARRVR